MFVNQAQMSCNAVSQLQTCSHNNPVSKVAVGLPDVTNPRVGRACIYIM